MDFVNPLTENLKMELGIRAAVRDVRSENLNYIQNPLPVNLYPLLPLMPIMNTWIVCMQHMALIRNSDR